MRGEKANEKTEVTLRREAKRAAERRYIYRLRPSARTPRSLIRNQTGDGCCLTSDQDTSDQSRRSKLDDDSRLKKKGGESEEVSLVLE